MTPKNSICLWYDTDAEEAANFMPGPSPTAR
jgi:predicted 3-demethylubiquinone-9 3-methyltransferase (glyoxalase superfamily)